MRFREEISCSVDDKGRVKMPVSMKKQFPADKAIEFVIGRDLDDCLVIYPLPVWEEEEKLLDKLSDILPKHRAYRLLKTSGLAEVSLDSADRFLIPKSLMNFLGSPREVILKGNKNKIQIWESKKLEQKISQAHLEIDGLAEDVFTFLDAKDESKS